MYFEELSFAYIYLKKSDESVLLILINAPLSINGLF